MKTLHLTNSWHDTSGGIATFYRALMEEANRRRQFMRLVVPSAMDRIEEVGSFVRIYHVQAPLARFNSRYRVIYPSQFLTEGSKLQQILAAERPDLVEICDKYTLNYLGILLRLRLLPALDFRPVVVGLSCERMDDNFRSYLGRLPFAAKFCDAYMKWLYFPFFDQHIANSIYTAAELQRAGEGQLVSRGTWVRPMGIDTSHLLPMRRCPAARRRLLQDFGFSEDTALLLYVGRLVPEKNLPLLFESLTHLARNSAQKFGLLVVGDGIERQRWENHCALNAPGRALFLGHVSDRNALADLYANSDVFVHPNPCEPFGIAPLEAMASGLPLVAPNVGGVTSYANPENAWTVAPDPESFAAAIEQVITDEMIKAQKTRNARLTAQRYGWDVVASGFLDLYGEMHRAATADADAPTLSPDFISTPATGGRAFLYHAISRSARQTFRILSKGRLMPWLHRRLGYSNSLSSPSS